MTLKLFNTLSRKKEIFKSLHKGRVGLYTCGPTVYNFAHIGNLRTYIFEDVLKRTLQYAGSEVQHVMNITDVDDKTIAGAAQENISLKKFTRRYETCFKDDLKKLNILSPTIFARATEHIDHTISDIAILLKKGFAYEKDGSVYFDVSKFKGYGKLARLDKKGMRDGARLDQDEYTIDEARDFVLWKARKDNEPAWKSPFGPGRPGWHIECSTMAREYLGLPLDIHAAGVDLIFPHHENEIAQAEAAHKKLFVKYWMHGEHLLVDNQKMSKSLGNIFTLHDLEKKSVSPLALRYLVLGAHYRSPLNFTWASLHAAESALASLYDFVRELKAAKTGVSNIQKNNVFKKLFEEALQDDLNTPKVLAIIWDMVHQYHKTPRAFDPKDLLRILYAFDSILGLRLKTISIPRIPLEIRVLVDKREKARQTKDFKNADAYRIQLQALGWAIKDTGEGPKLIKL